MRLSQSLVLILVVALLAPTNLFAEEPVANHERDWIKIKGKLGKDRQQLRLNIPDMQYKLAHLTFTS